MTQTTLFLAEVGRRWMDETEPRRKAALEEGALLTGFDREMLVRDFAAVGSFLAYRAYSFDHFAAELGDEWAMDSWRRVQASRVKAFPRGVVIHGMVGNIPLASLFSLIRGLITRNLNLAKVSTLIRLSQSVSQS